jgi:hypothetical protein
MLTDELLQRLFLPYRVRIKRVITDLPRLTPDQISDIKFFMVRYSAYVGFRSVERGRLDDLLDAKPINLVALRGILVSVKLASGELTLFGDRPRGGKSSEEAVDSYAQLTQKLQAAYDQMVAEERELRTYDRQISEQDTGAFQHKIALLTSIAAISAALAAAGSFVVACLQYFRGH